jgi:uncharacterized protein (TIGR02466 family)
MRKILNLFSIPVLEARIPEIDNDYIVQEINNVFDSMPVKRVLSEHWNENLELPDEPKSGYSTFNDLSKDLLQNPNFNSFFSSIDTVIDQFFAQLGFDGLWQYENSWASIYPRGAYVARHNHGTAHWSGVYYVEVPDEDAKICFDDPKEYSLSHEPHGFKFRGRMQHTFVPTPGTLLLWPGYVNHSSLPNNSDLNRTIISFNINCLLEK